MSDDIIKRLRDAIAGCRYDSTPLWISPSIGIALLDEIERLRAEVGALRDEKHDLRDVLIRGGFVPCDIPACNCGSWHARFGYPERMREIADALADAGHELSNENGNKPLNALRELVAEVDALRADAERYRWLRGDLCPDNSVRWAQWEVRCWRAPFWTVDLRREELDGAIAASMAKDQK